MLTTFLVGGRASKVTLFKTQLQEQFKLTKETKLKKHLGINYQWNEDSDGPYIIMTMDAMIGDIIQDFEALMGRSCKKFDTPAYPETTLLKNVDKPTHLHQDYMRLVGKLKYLTSKIAYELSYIVRELARHLKNPNKLHWKHLERIVGFIKRHRKDI